jgi:predicted amidophosphoribosyltransferase
MSETTTNTSISDYDHYRLRSMIQEAMLKTTQLGQIVLDLYAQGQLTHAAITPLCEELLALEKQILPAPLLPNETAGNEATVSPSPPVMATEPPQAQTQPTPEPAPSATHCPDCHTPITPGKKFCTKCGHRLNPVGEPATPTPATPPMVTPAVAIQTPDPLPFVSPVPMTPPLSTTGSYNTCVTCGTELMPNAAFCTNCGQPIGPGGQQPVYSPPPIQATAYPPVSYSQGAPSVSAGPITKFCQNCGKGLTAEVTVCPECRGSQFVPA